MGYNFHGHVFLMHGYRDAYDRYLDRDNQAESAHGSVTETAHLKSINLWNVKSHS